MKVNLFAAADGLVPLGVFTWTFTVPVACAGACTVIFVAETTVKVVTFFARTSPPRPR